jgi:hypothetical protein
MISAPVTRSTARSATVRCSGVLGAAGEPNDGAFRADGDLGGVDLRVAAQLCEDVGAEFVVGPDVHLCLLR